MKTGFNRRAFLCSVGAAGVFSILPRRLVAGSGEAPPSETVRFAAVGVGGQGRADLKGLVDAGLGEVVAVADVDPRSLAATQKFLPDVQTFVDYREMYDKAGKRFDAVLVATPDHWHALPTVEAMQLGKHVYTEKPIARTVWEVRRLMEAARRYNVVTHMGNQGHSFASHQTFVSWVRKGLLGEIREVHTWTTMRLLDSASKIPELAKHEKLPEGLDWERWIGPAEYHPYSPYFTPNRWRAWTPFGTGNPGDWGCHLLDPIYDALNLRSPQRITAEVTPGWDPVRDRLAFPNASRIRYEYDLANGKTLTIVWHDGEFCNEVPRPPVLEEGRELGNRIVPGQWNAGAVVYGSKHTLKYGSHGADGCRVIPESEMRAMIRNIKEEEKTKPNFWMTQIGSHFEDFVTAIKIGRKSNNPFETAGHVAENAALGAIAVRHPNVRLEWDCEAMRFKNCDSANALVEPHYRKGFSLKV
ncbi:MAG TPA: Gfo/Idh/MocA family oxidoreductase [Kiritimatiellia bacterium]|nr:Gfo/Idh/MocA family oxidoreductase [Kiritimatiellia bacterium]